MYDYSKRDDTFFLVKLLFMFYSVVVVLFCWYFSKHDTCAKCTGVIFCKFSAVAYVKIWNHIAERERERERERELVSLFYLCSCRPVILVVCVSSSWCHGVGL